MSRRVLVNQLCEARQSFAGLGTRRAKLQLQKMASVDPLARAFKIALEIEDCSTQAKKYRGEWGSRYYIQKHLLIQELIKICRIEDWTFGKHDAAGYPPHIIYFELPLCEQISFHAELDDKVPDYAGEWDGQRCSTFGKLEAAVVRFFDSERILYHRFEIE